MPVVLLPGMECSQLLRRRLFLMLRLPFFEGHAVDGIAGFVLGQVEATLGGGFAVPISEAVAAESGNVHQIDVLDVRTLFIEVFQQAAQDRGLQFGSFDHRLALRAMGRSVLFLARYASRMDRGHAVICVTNADGGAGVMRHCVLCATPR